MLWHFMTAFLRNFLKVHGLSIKLYARHNFACFIDGLVSLIRNGISHVAEF